MLNIVDTHMDANQLCLAFANTMNWHASDDPQESLHTYVDLIEWTHGEGLITESEKNNLLRIAEERPAEAKLVLQQAVTLREVIYRIFAALAIGDSPSETDLAVFNAALSRAMSGAHLIQSEAGFVWDWNVEEDALDIMLGPVIRSAGVLLTSELSERVGHCADNRGCGWLFLDTSKNRSRRWCSMNDCGNRAKQHRHYQRKVKSKI
jgi:predicted RNA-binding Zn ribbon-like protein